jgi:PhzF family phenazine biosynthesis protein
MQYHAQRFAGFSHQGAGGNPAGVLIFDGTLSDTEMLSIAKQIGDSETVFATPINQKTFKIRYFAPEAEVDFCGHATIALAKAIQFQFGIGHYDLNTNKGRLALEITDQDELFFTSPPTSSRALTNAEIEFLLDNSSLTDQDISANIPPAMVNAGNDHAFIAVNQKQALSSFEYNYDALKAWMQQHRVVTFAVGYFNDQGEIAIRNGFAYGGVYEDPATGAAAAAISGYLRDKHLTTLRSLTFHQGVEMGQPCVLKTQFSDHCGSGIRVGGEAYFIESVK